MTPEQMRGRASEYRTQAGNVEEVISKMDTLLQSLLSVLPLVDLVLVMTVEPGFGGQAFQAGQMSKISDLRKMGYVGLIEADGGLSIDNIPMLRDHGLDIAVMGTAMFKSKTPKEDMALIHTM